MSEIAPSRSDADVAAGAELLGGPMGKHRYSWRHWTPLQTIVLVGSVTFWLGFARTVPCMVNGWTDPDRYEHLCYSDIPILYSLRGLADGIVPYFEWPVGSHPLEYPVLIGSIMFIVAKATDLLTGAQHPAFYYALTMVVMFGFYLVALVATAKTVKHRVWDGMLLALSPVVFLASTINWDWPAIALTALGLFFWARSRPTWAGVFLGLAIAAKFYPLLLLGPIFLLCLRAGRWQAFGKFLLGAAGTWLVVNLPIMLLAGEGWSYFFTFSADRGQDFGSFWLGIQIFGAGVPASSLNLVATLAFLVICVGIALVALLAPTRPRIAQLAFLVVAAFLITNKVYSPQFVLWLVPLAILARPRWRDLIWWQAAEVIYFISIWWYLVGLTADGAKGLPQEWYAVSIFIHIAATATLMAVVVRDIWWPQHDPVRTGRPDQTDDPGGGVLDGATDRFTLLKR